MQGIIQLEIGQSRQPAESSCNPGSRGIPHPLGHASRDFPSPVVLQLLGYYIICGAEAGSEAAILVAMVTERYKGHIASTQEVRYTRIQVNTKQVP